jgi:hypothetical protein
LTWDSRLAKFGDNLAFRIVDDVLRAVKAKSFGVLRFDDAGLSVDITSNAGQTDARVLMNFLDSSDSELDAHFEDIEGEIENKVRERAPEVGDIPTFLLLDISSVGWSWLRPQSVWAAILASKLKGQPYAGLGLMVSALDSELPLQMHTFFASSAPPELVAAFNKLVRLVPVV